MGVFFVSLSLTVQVRISQDKKSSATSDAEFLQSWAFLFRMVVIAMDGKRSDVYLNRSLLVFYFIRIRGTCAAQTQDTINSSRTYMNLCRPQESNPWLSDCWFDFEAKRLLTWEFYSHEVFTIPDHRQEVSRLRHPRRGLPRFLFRRRSR